MSKRPAEDYDVNDQQKKLTFFERMAADQSTAQRPMTLMEELSVKTALEHPELRVPTKLPEKQQKELTFFEKAAADRKAAQTPMTLIEESSDSSSSAASSAKDMDKWIPFGGGRWLAEDANSTADAPFWADSNASPAANVHSASPEQTRSDQEPANMETKCPENSRPPTKIAEITGSDAEAVNEADDVSEAESSSEADASFAVNALIAAYAEFEADSSQNDKTSIAAQGDD